MNTSDTEWDSDKEVVGSDCLCVLGSEKHNPECEYAKPTPDTEWQKAREETFDEASDVDILEPDGVETDYGKGFSAGVREGWNAARNKLLERFPLQAYHIEKKL